MAPFGPQCKQASAEPLVVANDAKMSGSRKVMGPACHIHVGVWFVCLLHLSDIYTTMKPAEWVCYAYRQAFRSADTAIYWSEVAL